MFTIWEYASTKSSMLCVGESVTCLSANEGARQVWRENGEAEQKKNEGEFESWRRAPAAREVWCRKVVCFTSKRVLCKARVLKPCEW